MVHALEKIHGLIQAGGVLLDIHPTPEPPRLEVRLGKRTILAGWLKETDDYVEYEDADAALTGVIGRGLFAVERQGRFAFLTYADSFAELREYLADEWKDAVIDDLTAARIEDLLSAPERDKEVILRESIQIARMKPVGNIDPRIHTNEHE